MKIADLVSMLTVDGAPMRFEAYDGSSFGPADAAVHPGAGQRARAALPGHRAG